MSPHLLASLQRGLCGLLLSLAAAAAAALDTLCLFIGLWLLLVIHIILLLLLLLDIPSKTEHVRFGSSECVKERWELIQG